MIHRILIKQVELNQQKVDILIERNLISRIGKDLVAEDAEVIDATRIGERTYACCHDAVQRVC